MTEIEFSGTISKIGAYVDGRFVFLTTAVRLGVGTEGRDVTDDVEWIEIKDSTSPAAERLVKIITEAFQSKRSVFGYAKAPPGPPSHGIEAYHVQVSASVPGRPSIPR